MDPELRSYLDDRFKGVHARLDAVEERGERTQELANDVRSELRELRARAEERDHAAVAAAIRVEDACKARTASVADRVADLEGDRKRVIGGIVTAVLAAVAALLGLGKSS